MHRRIWHWPTPAWLARSKSLTPNCQNDESNRGIKYCHLWKTEDEQSEFKNLKHYKSWELQGMSLKMVCLLQEQEGRGRRTFDLNGIVSRPAVCWLRDDRECRWECRAPRREIWQRVSKMWLRMNIVVFCFMYFRTEDDAVKRDGYGLWWQSDTKGMGYEKFAQNHHLVCKWYISRLSVLKGMFFGYRT